MGEDPNQRGNSRRWIIHEVENSLRRLGTDYLDQIRRYDPETDLDETLSALSDLVRSGKVGYIGHSTWPVSAIVEAQWTARERGRERFRAEQPENQRKLEAAGQPGELADKTGITLIEMAIAFVLRHPAITSAIIGPRITEHLESQLTAADIELSDDTLDRIDEIVPPGITLNRAL